MTWPGTLGLRRDVPIGEAMIFWPGKCQERIARTHMFSSSSHGSSSSICKQSSEFSRDAPGNLVIKIEIFLLNGVSGCSPQLRTFGTGIPAASAICIETASSMLVRFVHFITSPNGNCTMLASKVMPNQEEYHRKKVYNDLWTRPHAILIALPGTRGTGG